MCIPVLLSILVGSLLSLVVWGFWQTRNPEVDDFSNDTNSVVLLGLAVLAVLALCVFLADVLLGAHAASFLHFAC
jgi:type III secretory pathway component EscT